LKKPKELTGMYELLEAIEETIKSADPVKRKALEHVLTAYAKDFPDEYFWAIGPQSPVMLHHIMFAIDQPVPSEPKRRGTRAPKAQKAH
jgi:hypothetical protein